VAEKLGMSSHELETTLAMFGLQDGEESLLSIWMTKINKKRQSNNTQNQIIIATLATIMYEDAEIPVTAPLLTVIHNRDWLSNDPAPTLYMAAKGISDFVVGSISEDKVTLINEMTEAL